VVTTALPQHRPFSSSVQAIGQLRLMLHRQRTVQNDLVVWDRMSIIQVGSAHIHSDAMRSVSLPTLEVRVVVDIEVTIVIPNKRFYMIEAVKSIVRGLTPDA
jgi:hypothetical protein